MSIRTTWPDNRDVATPFLKWAGGKGKLASAIVSLIPDAARRYHEPFLGAGAAFFKIEATRPKVPAYLNDANRELMESFTVVRDRPGELIDALHQLAVQFLRYDDEGRREVYYRVRAEEPTDPVERAARFLFLNRTGYNGLYRVNSRGKFNVPYGRYANPRILYAKGLLEASTALANASLTNDDFATACCRAERGDVVYFDPPYQPLSETSSFTRYTTDDFGPDDQLRLAEQFELLTQRGVAAILSNSVHEAVESLYTDKGYNVRKVPMARSINSDASGRQPIEEFLIDNLSRPEVAQWASGSPK